MDPIVPLDIALEKSGNDVGAATDALVEILLADDAAWTRAVEAITVIACRYSVRHVRTEIRAALLSTGEDAEAARQAAGDRTSRRLAVAARANLEHWYSWPLSSTDKFLGDATRAEIETERVGYQKRADSNGARARMFERIYAAMKDKGTVRAPRTSFARSRGRMA